MTWILIAIAGWVVFFRKVISLTNASDSSKLVQSKKAVASNELLDRNGAPISGEPQSSNVAPLVCQLALLVLRKLNSK